jgi:hypothetical protein
MQDYEQLQQLDPQDPEIQVMVDRARKALGLTPAAATAAAAAGPRPVGMRIPVVEESGEEEDEYEAPGDAADSAQRQPQQQQTAATQQQQQQQQHCPRVSPRPLRRIPVQVVSDDSGSDSDSASDDDAEQQQQPAAAGSNAGSSDGEVFGSASDGSEGEMTDDDVTADAAVPEEPTYEEHLAELCRAAAEQGKCSRWVLHARPFPWLLWSRSGLCL